MKKIEDYIHLYIGCDVMVTHNADITPKKAKLIGAYIDEWKNGQYHPTVQVDFGRPTQRLYYLLSQVKLLLRPLSSMTEEEERHMISTQDDVKLDGYPEILLKADSGETFRWMLSKGFDLFDLIESGLALDSTKIEKV